MTWEIKLDKSFEIIVKVSFMESADFVEYLIYSWCIMGRYHKD